MFTLDTTEIRHASAAALFSIVSTLMLVLVTVQPLGA